MRLWFVVPAHGREDLTRICLNQLARTCEQLHPRIDATAVVIGEGNNLKHARTLGFGTVNRTNTLLGRKFNDGFQLATDPDINPQPADYVIPFGSDNWIDHDIIEPHPTQIVCFKQLAIVNETRTLINTFQVPYAGGCGIRIIPTPMLTRLKHRPAVEDAKLGIDTGILRNLGRNHGGRMNALCRYADIHDFQIVDWKSTGQQLHSYRELRSLARRGMEFDDPLGILEAAFPEAVEEIRAL